MTSAEVIFAFSSLKDSNYIFKDTGPLFVFRGSFLRHEAFISRETPFPLSGGPRTGNHLLHISTPYSVYLGHSDVTSLPADFFLEMA